MKTLFLKAEPYSWKFQGFKMINILININLTTYIKPYWDDSVEPPLAAIEFGGIDAYWFFPREELRDRALRRIEKLVIDQGVKNELY